VSGNSSKDNIDFINLPLLLKIAPSEKINLVVGPQFGFLQSAKTEFNGAKGDIEGIKSTNTSFVFGIGLQATSEFEIYARYSLGVTNLNDDSSLDLDAKINTVQLGIAINLLKN
jgi:hypothetical protein